MAPEHIDLTGSDDELQGNDAPPRPSSQLAPSSARRSVVSNLKRNTQPEETPNSSQRRNGLMDQTERYAPSKNGQSTNRRSSLNGSFQQLSRLGMSQAQSTQGRGIWETGVNSAFLSRNASQNSQTREPAFVSLIEDEVPRPKFRMPPGLESNGSAKSPTKSAGPGSSFDGNSVVGRKRSLERDSPLNGFSPSKRLKVAQRDGEMGSNPNSQSESFGSVKGPREAINRSAERLFARSTSNMHHEIDLRSPSRERTQRSPQNSREQADVISTQKTRPVSSTDAVNGVYTKGNSYTHPTGKLLSSNSDDVAETPVISTKDRSRKSPPKPSISTTPSDPVAFREQRVQSRGGATPSNSDLMPLGSPGTPSQEQNQSTSRKVEAPKIQSPVLNKTNRPLNSSQSQTPGRQNRTTNQETSEGALYIGPRDHDSRGRRKTTDQISSLASKDAVERIISNGSTPNSAAIAVRRVSSEEDPGYASLSSGDGRNSKRRSWDEPTIGNRSEHRNQSHSPFAGSKSQDKTRPGNDEDDKAARQTRKNDHQIRQLSDEQEVQDDEDPPLRHSARPRTEAGTLNRDEVAGGLTRAEKTMTAAASSLRAADITQTTLSRTPASEKSSSHSVHPFSQLRRKPDVPFRSLDSKSKRNLHVEVKNAHIDMDGVDSVEPPTKENITEAEEADFQLRSEAMQGDVENQIAGDAEREFAPPTISASALKASSVYSTLPLASQVEKVLGKYFEEVRGDNEYWTSVAMRRARLTNEEELNEVFSEPSSLNPEEFTSFGHLKPLKLSMHKKGTKSEEDIWGIQRMTADGKPQAHIEMSAPFVTFSTDQPDVPNYAHYVSIKNNILAPNVIHLHCWPYFGDDFDCNKAHNLHDQYKIDIRERERKLLLLLKAQKYEDYVESALHDLECSWSDVLRFLLEKEPDVGSDLGAKKAYENRPQYCQEDFSRNSSRWEAVLNSLPPSSPDRLGRVAVLCENFQKMAKFSLWHIARKSDFAKLAEEVHTPTAAQTSDNELTCRICLRFNCPYHGYFKHSADDSGSDSDGESVSSVDSVVATDIIHPLKANYRSRVAFPPDPPTESTDIEKPPAKRKQRDPNYWSGYRHKAEDRGPFYPCHHPDSSCEDANCRCFRKMVPCEKSCNCASDCARKFKGCSCGLKKGHKLVCFEDADCVCWQLGRECDPDLCGNCGVCDVVDPINKYNDGILIGRCRNASIQRGVPKHTLLGDSGVHGLGLYACENIRQNDFVGEYKGEVIAKREADRRGAVYEHQKLSYLFSLNKAQEIDSTYFGNKVRFINHAHGDKANLYPRIIMVNTVHRIALYAGKDIHAGKELLFDYGPYFPDEQLQGKKSKKSATESKKSAPHVRNANLVKEFYDVEESEDEDGILRAKAVSRSANGPRGRGKGKKPRGGARSGAGRKPNAPKGSHREPLQDSEAEARKGPDAGVRLAAFNISDDITSEAMEVDAEGGAEDDEAFEPEGSESDDSEESDSERSEFEDEDEELDHARGHWQRGAVRTRRYGRG